MSNRTIVAIILDQSGSMEICRGATISAFNEYVNDLKRDKQDECLLALTKFNTVCTVVHGPKAIADIAELTRDTYTPGGNTALYDAIAETAEATEKHVQADDKVLCVIITDGEENSSKETTRDQAMALIKAKEAQGNWTFAYIGANQDAWAVGTGLGIAGGNTQRYDTTDSGVASMSVRLAASTHAYRATVSAGSRTNTLFIPPTAPQTTQALSQTATNTGGAVAELNAKIRRRKGSRV